MSDVYKPPLNVLDDEFVGMIVGSILYGAYVSLALSNIYFLWQRGSRKFLLSYTILLLCVTTIYMGVGLNYAQTQFVDDPYSPSTRTLSVWPEVVIDVAYSVNTWLTDGYLLFRCFAVWAGRFQTIVLIPPVLIYLASIATSMALLIFTARPGASYGSRLVILFGTANWSLSLALNMIITALIASRLLWYRSRVCRALGKNHGKVYSSILAISIESAVLYAAFELIILCTFATNNVVENTFFPMSGNVQVIVPNLIILRVVKGKSFTTEDSIVPTISQIMFSSREGQQEESTGSSTQAGTDELKQSQLTLSANGNTKLDV